VSSVALVRFRVPRSREDEDLGVAAKLRDEFQSALLAEVEVEQHDIRRMLLHGGNCIALAGDRVGELHLRTGALYELAQAP